MSDQTSEKKYTCIMCPLGCEVTVKADETGKITEVLGNKCAKGEKYARDEATHPVRFLTSTVAIDGAAHARLPVRTSAAIPKDRMFDCMNEIRKIKVKAPVKIGDKVIENILGLGVDVVATRNL
jgi:CxxC motif-containing protein